MHTYSLTQSKLILINYIKIGSEDKIDQYLFYKARRDILKFQETEQRNLKSSEVEEIFFFLKQ